MTAFENLTLNELMNKQGFDCDCGKHHSVSCDFLAIEKGAVNRLGEAVRAVGGKRPFVICDANTYRAAGEKACAVLKRKAWNTRFSCSGSTAIRRSSRTNIRWAPSR